MHNRVGSAVHFLCCSVAVLQFQNRLYESQKLTLYLYNINIEVFLGYGNSLERTATLQQLQHMTAKNVAKIWLFEILLLILPRNYEEKKEL